MHHLTRPRTGLGWWGGFGSTSALIHPTIKTLWKTNVCLAKVKALEPGAHPSVCPGFLPFIPARCFVFFFFFFFPVSASTLPRSFGQDIKQDPRGSDSQPFPTRGIHTVTTANCLDYDNSAWRRRKSGKGVGGEGEKSQKSHGETTFCERKNNQRHQKTQTEDQTWLSFKLLFRWGAIFKPVNFWAPPYSAVRTVRFSASDRLPLLHGEIRAPPLRDIERPSAWQRAGERETGGRQCWAF